MNKVMDKKLLVNCDGPIFPDLITEALKQEHIGYEVNDNQLGIAIEARTGTDIYVDAKDLQRAQELIKPIMETRKQAIIWCPKCGSEDVTVTPVHKNCYSTTFTITGLILFILSGFYFIVINPEYCEHLFSAWNILFLILALVGLSLFSVHPVSKHNCHCNHCGHDFRHV